MSDSKVHTPDPADLDRRPLASRGWPVMHSLAGAVAAAGITPNAVSTAGMVFGIGAGLLLGATACADGLAERAAWLGAAACVQLRLVCNLIDGMVAVEGGKRSALGEIYNEVPDRVSDAATLIAAGYALGSSPVLGYITACLALFVAYLRAVGKGAGMVSDYSGPMAKQQRMFVVTVAGAALGVLPRDWRPVTIGMLDSPAPGIMFFALGIIAAGSVVTAARRLAHLAAFLRQRGVR
jgi:phosphatidylglycerophosphate synthase